ncbi:hypothetical protein [Aquimarina sediminis]|uniref:hypothetical protein n=1 Tax=Aquimarina sediminis TaxID=2070536 RepID=UPI000FFF32DA|nr:hypothetical protein [Aquimarina sediminis]
MKITILITSILLSCSTLYSQEKKEKNNKRKTDIQKVFICNSTNSKRYHYKSDCTGLKKCKDTIRRISIRIAKSSHGRILCGFEVHLESASIKNN